MHPSPGAYFYQISALVLAHLSAALRETFRQNVGAGPILYSPSGARHSVSLTDAIFTNVLIVDFPYRLPAELSGATRARDFPDLSRYWFKSISGLTNDLLDDDGLFHSRTRSTTTDSGYYFATVGALLS